MEAVLNGCLSVYMYCFELMRICEKKIVMFVHICIVMGDLIVIEGITQIVLLNSVMSVPSQDLVIQSHMSCWLSSMVYCEKWLIFLMIFVELTVDHHCLVYLLIMIAD